MAAGKSLWLCFPERASLGSPSVKTASLNAAQAFALSRSDVPQQRKAKWAIWMAWDVLFLLVMNHAKQCGNGSTELTHSLDWVLRAEMKPGRLPSSLNGKHLPSIASKERWSVSLVSACIEASLKLWEFCTAWTYPSPSVDQPLVKVLDKHLTTRCCGCYGCAGFQHTVQFETFDGHKVPSEISSISGP